MVNSPNERVDVIVRFTHSIPQRQSNADIYKIRWGEKEYKVVQFGLHHLEKRGKILFHIFSVCTTTLNFKLSFNTKTLVWRLEGVSDATRYQSS